MFHWNHLNNQQLYEKETNPGGNYIWVMFKPLNQCWIGWNIFALFNIDIECWFYIEPACWVLLHDNDLCCRSCKMIISSDCVALSCRLLMHGEFMTSWFHTLTVNACLIVWYGNESNTSMSEMICSTAFRFATQPFFVCLFF